MPDIKIKYKKLGSIGKTNENELVLTDESSKHYKVEGAVASVWNMCDGIRTIDDISGEISKQAGADKAQVKDAVMKIVAQLERFKLLKRV